VKKVFLCPRCGSRNIDYASISSASQTFLGLGLPELFYCKDCGYLGPLVIEIDSKGERHYKQFVKRRKKPSENEIKSRGKHSVIRPVFLAVLLFFFVSAVFFMLSPTSQGLAVSSVVDNKANIVVGVENVSKRVPALKESTLAFNASGGKVYVRIIDQGDMKVIKASAFNIVKKTDVVISDENKKFMGVITLNPPSLLERSTGVSSVTGLFYHLFLMFFVLALIALMIYSHWQRLRSFIY